MLLSNSIKITKIGYVLKEATSSASFSTPKKIKYSFVRVVCEPKACETCQSHDGSLVAASNGVIGKHLPPFHPNCKCVTEPWKIDPWQATIYIWSKMEDIRMSYEQRAQLLIDFYAIVHIPNLFIQKALFAIMNSKNIVSILDRVRVFSAVLKTSLSNLSDPKFYKTAVKTTVGGWMDVYDIPTVTANGRDVIIPKEFENNWFAFEGLDDINPWARHMIGDGVQVYVGDSGEVTDYEGRYWIAVGPNVMNPEHKPTEAITLDEMKYGSKLDVVLQDADGNAVYLPCVVGETKAHTYPNGIFQTGSVFPNGEEFVPGTGENGAIEFVGAILPKGLGQYKLVKIIVYEQ